MPSSSQTHGSDLHITQSDHADRLPDTQADSRSNAAVQPLETVVLVDVFERLADGQVLGPVGVVLLALHLDTDDLDRLVPGRKTTTKSAGGDLFNDAQLLATVLASHLSDTTLGNARQTEPATPVGHLPDRNGVDTLVDTTNTFTTVDVHEGLHGARGLHSGGSNLVLRDLDRLHASAETHGGISLSKTSNHTTSDTTDEVVCAEDTSAVFGFGCDEKQDGTLCGCFNPGLGDVSQSLLGEDKARDLR